MIEAYRRRRWILGSGRGIVAAAICARCGSVPPPAYVPASVPSTAVYFYPASGQSTEQQDRDRYECNAWAVRQSGFDPSAPTTPPHLRYRVVAEPVPGSGVATGAIAGALIGAGLSRPWEAGRGALLGAVAGAALGGVVESAATAQARAQSQPDARETENAVLERHAENFRRAMSACLEARGYTVR